MGASRALGHTAGMSAAEGIAGTDVETGRVLVAEGIELAWTARGEGPPLLLVHGFTGSQADWDGVVEAVAAAGRRVVTVDQRGHGQSSHADGEAAYTFDLLIADLAAFVDALGLDGIDLLGHSMGGMVVMRYALAHQDRLTSLVLMDTAGEPPKGVPMEDFFRAGIDVVRSGGMEAIAAVMGPMTPEEDRDRALAGLRAMDPAAFIGLAEALIDHPSALDQLGALRVPTTVLVGEHDLPLRAASDDLAAAVPGAHLVVIPEAMHSPQIENRDAWLEAMRAHLATAPG